ncbi:hypothetical protein K469DRAFT_545936 [Zopfia rhizophila CBS 207.26]|uniref:Extracellular membrane protein CFEM domain-containing protein n=1 Tax=Zopfia rhizophila CBS 207.26 TaxID=1314779 RepID=A0A6A6F0V0_9PEZI|nr:hypothetical protein K469DRAFT_545936 [Zopfia rhizophila CBS 207.26]
MFTSVTLLGLGAIAAATPYDGPVATPSIKKYSADGWTPKPTSAPIRELFRRQEDPALCGYLEGDPAQCSYGYSTHTSMASAISCDAGYSCMYDEDLSWFGCCTGRVITDCDVMTACVESASISECLSVSECVNDPLAMACTDSSRPYCAHLYTVVTGETYGHLVCANTETTAEILPSASGAASSVEVVETLSEITDDGPISTRRPQTVPASPTTGGAARTGAAVVGAAGGVAGLLVLLA